MELQGDNPVMRLLAVLLLAVLGWTGEAALFRQGVGVEVSVSSDAGGPVLVAVFTPKAQEPPLHLYSKDLDPATGGGWPTRLELAPGAPVQARGPLSDDRPTHLLDGLAVYPEGATVTLRLPISAPPGRSLVPVLVSYMACTRLSCNIPVQRAPLSVLVEGSGVAAPVLPRPEPVAIPVPRPAIVVNAIAWQRPADRAALEALLREAKAAGRPVLLDFTGPSCVNCQLMAKTVFRLPAVTQAIGGLLAIEIDTDPPHDDFAAWQQERFATQNRPLYVRLAADGGEARWDRVFAPTDAATLARFLAFLHDGASAAGDASGAPDGLGRFILLAILGGLFTLLMPCTYPMIPLTVNVFAKQAAAGRRLLPLALFFGGGIIACFVGLGVLITGVFGASLATLAGHPLTNLVIGAMFAVLGLSLLGVFFLRLPSWMGGLAGGAGGGYVGALLMGLTFAITAFTCTAPFAGAVLAAGVSSGAWGAAVGGMALYSATIAIPFVGLALSPGLLARIPRAGAWMNEFKVVGGLIEIAAAFKFLAICDYAWHWGLIGRTSTLVVWTAIALACSSYIAGWWRHDGDERVEHLGADRLVGAIVFLALAIWLGAGVGGLNLGFVEAFFPGDAAP